MLNPTEHQIQSAYFDWIKQMRPSDYRYKNIFAIPNGAKLPYLKNKNGKRSSPQAAILLKEGLTPGVWDVLISWPLLKQTTNNMIFCGCYIEFKAKKNVLTSEQKLFQHFNPYYHFEVCRKVEDAINVTKQWFKGAK